MVFDVKIPILGFNNVKKVSFEKIDDTFAKINDIQNSNISFSIVNPYILRDYDFEISDETKTKLQIEKDSDIMIYNIMVLQNPIEKSFINFLAPLIFNKTKKVMGQVILDNNKYPFYSIADNLSNYLSKN